MHSSLTLIADQHYRERYQFRIYAYVLMPNHVHLLLETTKTPLSKILEGI